MRLQFFIFALAALLLTGCNVIVLANGKYETSQPGRDDFIAVYNDILIMRLRNPEKASGTDDGYWDWGGKFDIQDNRIIPHMTRADERKWSFYYEFYKVGNAIKVNDLRAENSFVLDYVPARTPPPMSAVSAADGGAKPEEIPASSYPEFK